MYSSQVARNDGGNSNGNYSMLHVSYANIGGPTQTTPTLTPTTLKSFIQEALDHEGAIPLAPMEHQHQAGFVPPIVANIIHLPTAQHNMNNAHLTSTTGDHQIIKGNEFHPGSEGEDESMNMFSDDDSSSQPGGGWASSNHAIESGSTSQNSNDSQMGLNGFESSSNKKVKKGKRSTGRKPRNSGKLTPEEEARRRVRRERNKLAAARCRKRRLDHTNDLMRQTDGLNQEQANLQNEFDDLKKEIDKFQFILDSHKPGCKLKGSLTFEVKGSSPFGDDGFLVTSRNGNNNSQPQQSKATIANPARSRPSSLQLSNSIYTLHGGSDSNIGHSQVVTSAAESLVPIQTPSAGIFNLDSIMEGGTGLTPLLTSQGFATNPSSCGGQQRNTSEMIASPENGCPPKLVSL